MPDGNSGEHHGLPAYSTGKIQDRSVQHIYQLAADRVRAVDFSPSEG
jgi:hypothetical protein